LALISSHANVGPTSARKCSAGIPTTQLLLVIGKAGEAVRGRSTKV